MIHSLKFKTRDKINKLKKCLVHRGNNTSQVQKSLGGPVVLENLHLHLADRHVEKPRAKGSPLLLSY